MKKILFGNDARQKIKAGIDKCVDVVKVTLGGKGKNVLIYNGTSTEIINDGVSIAHEVNVKDEVEQAGIQLAKQCANQTNEDAGDGTTTTLVLLQSILNEIITDIQTENPRTVRDRLFNEANEVLAKVEVKQIENGQDVYNLALTSSLNQDMAEVIKEIYNELGKDAKISIEETSKNVLEKTVLNGIKFESKKAESKLLRNDEKKVIDNCFVAVIDKVESIEDVQKKMAVALEKKADGMVIISNQFDRKVLLALMQVNNFNIIPIEYTMMKPIEDLETYAGDEPVKRVIIEKDFTTIIGGKGDVDSLVKTLEDRMKDEESLFEKENLESRIAQLKGKIAIIKIGRNTDVERQEAVLKLEDAIGSVKGAYELGYCKGGGLALKEAGYRFNVHKQLRDNAGGEIEIPDTVIDSFKTVKHSLLNALSTATSILMVESALIKERDDD